MKLGKDLEKTIKNTFGGSDWDYPNKKLENTLHFTTRNYVNRLLHMRVETFMQDKVRRQLEDGQFVLDLYIRQDSGRA